MPNSTCYQVETHWSFDGSTAENEWGWNRDRAVEGEAAILQAMTDSFTITAKILPTQEDAAAASTGFTALDATLKQLGDTTRSTSLTLMLNGGKRYEGSATDNRVYFSRQLREDLVWRAAGRALHRRGRQRAQLLRGSAHEPLADNAGRNAVLLQGRRE